MDGVLEGATVLCVCKLACSLLFLPSLAASQSPVSFCCCCLLIFTDFLVAVFLSFLTIFESWLTELTPLSDIIALRFLLFLSHTYGAGLLLTTPLIAVETLTRLLWPHSVVAQRTASQTEIDSDGQRCYVGEVTVEEEEDSDGSDKDDEKVFSHVVSYLCCLSVWVIVALNVSWRWKLEEVWASACLHMTNSLISCLPNLYRPMPITMNPSWVFAILFLFLLLLTMSMGLHKQKRAPARMVGTQREKRRVNSYSSSCRQGHVPALHEPSEPVKPGMSVSAAAQCVDPEKTESSCTAHTLCSWNSVQMSVRHHRDFVLISPECLSAGQEHERTKTGIPLTFIIEDHIDSQYRSKCGWREWGFPRLGANAVIGFLAVLFTFVLPLNLSVNILLIRTIETLLELCIKSLAPSAANTSNTSNSHSETLA